MRISVSILIDAPQQPLFDLSQDYTRRTHWDPFLREARMLGDVEIPSVGARSWCVTWFGMGMETEYVSFKPPDVAAVKMTKGPWMFSRFAASWNFKSQERNSTIVDFVYSFELCRSLRILTPLVGLILRIEMRQRLRALARACASI